MNRNGTLVLLQGTPFCNISCGYCYLPDRTLQARMSEEVQRRVFEEVLASDLVEPPVDFLWHLGEPLAIPPAFYRQAFGLATEINKKHDKSFIFSVQTNATLVSQPWIELLRDLNFRVGVSVDGPRFIHDRRRVSRSGRGTFDRVMAGIRALQNAGIVFGVISVLTDYSLDFPDELFDFYVSNGITQVAFNIDEIEGINSSSSFANISGSVDRYKRFMARIVERVDASQEHLQIREVVTNLRSMTSNATELLNTLNQPFKIFNFDHEGNFTTFCPELLAARDGRFGRFVMGNVVTGRLADIKHDPVFLAVGAEIQAGVDACRKSCQYWSFCGGGFPSNKYFEHGRFDVTETITCKVHVQATVDVLLEHLEGRLAIERQIDSIPTSQTS